ncbi:hypothetical protein Taro_021265 [Colocasia esculenta]|uniref:3-hydroxyisobutyryl-CoA hydrolase n=1 Tax=Colocasia esculenta TaxID=4460 RepID=A0A843UYI3_COLES|nr:hypothetical protein [Colocasia esculenta]
MNSAPGKGIQPSCVLCGMAEESIDHIFTDSSYTSTVWRAMAVRIHCTIRSHLEIKQMMLEWKSSDDPHLDVQAVLATHSEQPESEAQLKLFLPQIMSSFGACKSVMEIVENLKKHQQSTDTAVAEWASDALAGLGKGAPFSLCLTEKHFSQVASAYGERENHLSNLNGVMKAEYRIALRSSLRHDFIEGVRAVLVDKDQNPKWNPARVEDVNMAEVCAVFEPLHPDVELDV